MKGYLKDEKVILEVFVCGWFYMGDMGVIYLDGYVEIKDRMKDVIILGGENISSVEVEGVIFKYYKVLEVVVIVMFYLKWGESFCVFIVFKKDNMEIVIE